MNRARRHTVRRRAHTHAERSGDDTTGSSSVSTGADETGGDTFDFSATHGSDTSTADEPGSRSTQSRTRTTTTGLDFDSLDEEQRELAVEYLGEEVVEGDAAAQTEGVVQLLAAIDEANLWPAIETHMDD